jgi:hypothetical protein
MAANAVISLTIPIPTALATATTIFLKTAITAILEVFIVNALACPIVVALVCCSAVVLTIGIGVTLGSLVVSHYPVYLTDIAYIVRAIWYL